MPELMPTNEFMDSVRRHCNETHCNLWPWEIEKIARENNQEVINSGEECVVIPGKTTDTRETVTAFSYFNLNPLRAKEIFYAQRIFSTLFPKNFPRFYSSFGVTADRSRASGTIREKIKENKGGEIKYPFKDVSDVCEKIGLPLLREYGDQNYLVGEDGGQYYVDTVNQFPPEFVDREKLIEYMQNNNYSKTDMRIVETCIDRLHEVYKQVKSLKEKK